MRNPIKAFFKSNAVARIASWAAASYIRVVIATSRVTFSGIDHISSLENQRKEGIIIIFWHSRIMLAPALRRHIRGEIDMLVSNHRDGEIIANAVKGFGIDFIRGSAANSKKTHKNKDGIRALKQMVSAIRSGRHVGVTPDGPRGPATEVHPGVVQLAKLSDAPVVPLAYATRHGKTLKTWDRFLLAFPFNKIEIVVGAPIDIRTILSSNGAEEARYILKTALDAAVLEAEKKVAN